MSMSVAKVFKNGQSQAVRLPKEFFARHEVCPEFELNRPDNEPPQERDLF